MKFQIGLSSKNKRKTFSIPVPEFFFAIDFEKLALEIYPHRKLHDRLLDIFTDLLKKSKDQDEVNKSGIKIFDGSASEIQLEAWEDGKHIYVARGQKYYCPCIIGLECILRKK